jgi:osmotically inducible protein OsmC
MANFSRHGVVDWNGEVLRGAGRVTAGTEAFTVPITFPRLAAEAPGLSTPEELLAASHATCFAIALWSTIGRRGGSAHRISVAATITADKGPHGIRIQSSDLRGVVEGLEGVDPAKLPEIAQAAEQECTISLVIRNAVRISFEVTAI